MWTGDFIPFVLIVMRPAHGLSAGDGAIITHEVEITFEIEGYNGKLENAKLDQQVVPGSILQPSLLSFSAKCSWVCA